MITFREYETLVFSPHADGAYAMELLQRTCPQLHNKITTCRPEFNMRDELCATDKAMAYLAVHWPKYSEPPQE